MRRQAANDPGAIEHNAAVIVNTFAQRSFQRRACDDGLARVGVCASKLDQAASADTNVGAAAGRPSGTANTRRTVVGNGAFKTDRVAGPWGQHDAAAAHDKQV